MKNLLPLITIFFLSLIISFVFLFVVSCTTDTTPGHSDEQMLTEQYVSSTSTEPQLSFQELNKESYFAWLTNQTDRTVSLETIAKAGEKDRIENLIQLLQNSDEQLSKESDQLTQIQKNEYRFFTKLYLSTLNRNLYNIEGDKSIMESAKEHQKSALSYIEDERYDSDRAFPEFGLANLICYQNNDEHCLDNYLSLLDEYEKTSLGSYPEWFAAEMILPGYVYYLKQHEDEKVRDVYFAELENLVGEDTPLGLSASITLGTHYLTEGKLDKVGEIIALAPSDMENYSEVLQSRWNNFEQGYRNFTTR